MSKVPGGQAPSDKYVKQQEQAQGLGASNAPGRTEGAHPLDQPAAADSGVAPSVGITQIDNKSAGKSGALGTEGAYGTTQVGSGAPTANIPPEQKNN